MEIVYSSLKLNWMVCLTEGKLPIMTASFDVVVTAWNKPELVGEHWLREIGRVLKPGGELILQSILSSGMLEKVAFFCHMKSRFSIVFPTNFCYNGLRR